MCARIDYQTFISISKSNNRLGLKTENNPLENVLQNACGLLDYLCMLRENKSFSAAIFSSRFMRRVLILFSSVVVFPSSSDSEYALAEDFGVPSSGKLINIYLLFIELSLQLAC